MAAASELATNDNLDLRQLLKVLVAVKKGDFSVRMPEVETGLGERIAETLNDIIEMNERVAKELDRISSVVGKEGRINQRASLTGAGGRWASLLDSVNMLIADLAQPTTEVARVIGAVAKGDLSQTMALEIEGRPVKGEFLRTGKIVNTMVDQLSSFASEVTRVAR
jgi:methyl-accepting chemotaxis protein